MKLNENIIRSIVRSTLNEMLGVADDSFIQKLVSLAKRKAMRILKDYFDKRFGNDEIPQLSTNASRDEYEDFEPISFDIQKTMMIPMNDSWYRCIAYLSMSVYDSYDGSDGSHNDIVSYYMRIVKIMNEQTKEVVYDESKRIGTEYSRALRCSWRPK